MTQPDEYSFDRSSKTLVFLDPRVNGEPVEAYTVQITTAGHRPVDENWADPLEVPDEGSGVLVADRDPGTYWIRTRVEDNPEVEVTLAAIVQIT